MCTPVSKNNSRCLRLVETCSSDNDMEIQMRLQTQRHMREVAALKSIILQLDPCFKFDSYNDPCVISTSTCPVVEIECAPCNNQSTPPKRVQQQSCSTDSPRVSCVHQWETTIEYDGNNSPNKPPCEIKRMEPSGSKCVSFIDSSSTCPKENDHCYIIEAIQDLCKIIERERIRHREEVECLKEIIMQLKCSLQNRECYPPDPPCLRKRYN